MVACWRNRSDSLFQTLLIAETVPAQVEKLLRRKSADAIMAMRASSSPLSRPDICTQSDSSCHQNSELLQTRVGPYMRYDLTDALLCSGEGNLSQYSEIGLKGYHAQSKVQFPPRWEGAKFA